MIRKADVSCPHCGHVQKEPKGAVSTFCRGCGDHFEIRQSTPPAPTVPPVFRPGPSREVFCYRCGTSHRVSPFAKSTICPACGVAIEFRDLDFSANASRPVDIRGHLSVRAGACLNHPRIICSSARIDGRVTGAILCEGKLELFGNARMAFAAVASQILIGKGASIQCGLPLECRDLEIRGHLAGDVLCGGKIIVRKGGCLEGAVDAPTLTIEKGGSWLGGGRIDPSATGQFPSMDLFLPEPPRGACASS